MLETIREYAAERLEASGTGERFQRRQAEFMEQRYAELDRANPSSWVAAVAADRDNLRAALRWHWLRVLPETSLVLANTYASLCIFDGPVRRG